MPRISLCMIVRDEEEMLPRFLACAAGLWDELCVVDTGSTDRTIAIAEAAGARIERRPWRDDFAWARNESLALATGDFILFLDADELATPAFVASARALAADDTVGAATALVRSPFPGGRRHESRLLRMFRRDPAIRFSHAIHEEVGEGVAAHLARTGRRLASIDGVVEHLGYARSHAAARGKRARDQSLLEKCIAADANDLYSHFRLMELARFWDDRALWRQAAVRAAPIVDATGGRLRSARWGGELIALVAEGLHPADPHARGRYLDARQGLAPPSAYLWLRRGEAFEAVGDAAAARRAFERGLGLGAATQDPQLATTRPRMGLARLALARGDLAAARRLADEALADNPVDPEALLCALTLARAAGGAAAVEARGAALLAAHGESPELDFALGEEAWLAGDVPRALAHLGRAAGDPPSGGAALRLAQARLATGDVTGARALAAALLPDQPEAGLGVLACDLCEGRSTALTLDLELDAADRAMRAWVAAVRRIPDPRIRATFSAAAPAVASIFPWLARGLG